MHRRYERDVSQPTHPHLRPQINAASNLILTVIASAADPPAHHPLQRPASGPKQRAAVAGRTHPSQRPAGLRAVQQPFSTTSTPGRRSRLFRIANYSNQGSTPATDAAAILGAVVCDSEKAGAFAPGVLCAERLKRPHCTSRRRRAGQIDKRSPLRFNGSPHQHTKHPTPFTDSRPPPHAAGGAYRPFDQARAAWGGARQCRGPAEPLLLEQARLVLVQNRTWGQRCWPTPHRATRGSGWRRAGGSGHVRAFFWNAHSIQPKESTRVTCAIRSTRTPVWRGLAAPPKAGAAPPHPCAEQQQEQQQQAPCSRSGSEVPGTTLPSQAARAWSKRR